MKKIAITGGIGSGKSFVCRIFEGFGIPVYNADREAKRLMQSNKHLKSSIKELLGANAYFKNGRPNRKFIATKIFGDKSLLNKINALVHPAVRDDFRLWAEAQNSKYVLEESAIVYEAGLDKFFDAVILVVADEKMRIKRIQERDGADEKSIKMRMKNQLSDKIKMSKADFIILNDGSKSLIGQVYQIHQAILKN